MKKSISGIRGVVGKDLELKDVIQFCSNFSKLIDSKKCVIGMDTRPSGNMIKEIASAALMQNGIDVFDLGVIPTPVIFREARKYGSGLIISSSHNPIEWNGLKFIINGRGINENELQTVITKQDLVKSEIGNKVSIETNYVEDALKVVGKINNPPKVVIDVGGGAAKIIALDFLKKLGCDIKIINENLENSSRGPDPTSENLDDLISNCENQDIGFAFDLDGDRLVVVKDGKKQTPDVTLGLGVAKALELGYKKFVLSVDSSIAIEKFITKSGGEVHRSKVGEANVIDLILKSNSQAGGEGSSGGFILPEFNYCRDGILTSGLIAIMLGSDSFNEILSFMESYHQVRSKIPAQSNLHDKTLEKIAQKMKEKYAEIITIDGIKGIIDEDTWVLVRKSNTEDIIRISAESNDLEKANRIICQTKELVNQCYEEIK